MNHEDLIQDLLKQADPLRPLDDDDPRKAQLTKLVDEINRLRREQELEAKREMMRRLEAGDVALIPIRKELGVESIAAQVITATMGPGAAEAALAVQKEQYELCRARATVEGSDAETDLAAQLGAMERPEMLALAEKLGVKIDKRWSMQKIGDAIVKAKS